MTHYLRLINDASKENVVDLETSKDELRVVVCVRGFSYLLLSFHGVGWQDLVDDFDRIQELRGEYWEQARGKVTPDELARTVLKEAASKYNLQYVTD